MSATLVINPTKRAKVTEITCTSIIFACFSASELLICLSGSLMLESLDKPFVVQTLHSERQLQLLKQCLSLNQMKADSLMSSEPAFDSQQSTETNVSSDKRTKSDLSVCCWLSW